MAKAPLEFRVLGELEVLRGGGVVALPHSKKTRALLAYLVLTEREHRRERLCDLFWDVADDKRGALRWSLSKLRALVDEEGASRIAADRDRISFASRGARVDVLELRRAIAAKPLASHATEDLERWAGAFRGELLEGLDLPDFDEYQAWCVAEREHARALRASLLAELVRRLTEEPERAVAHARAWVAIDPLEDTARAALVRLLGRLGRRDEARQHYEAGRRLEKELARNPSEELAAAWRSVDDRAKASPTPAAAAAPAPIGAEAVPLSRVAPLVGRARELAALEALGAKVERDGRLAAIVVTGEPGIGKTRLLQEWMQRVRARGGAAVFGAAFEAESGNPYGPWLDALAEGNRAEALVAEVLGGERPSRERLFARVSAALGEIAPRDRLLVIVLDDVQWLDEASAELLHWVARTGREHRVVLALATREGEIADNAPLVRVLRGLRREGLLEELALRPLLPEDTAALATTLGVRSDAADLHARSGGNPLFARELALAAASSPGADAFPASVGGLVRDRIAQLPEGAAEVVRWGAVLGGPWREEHLEPLSTLGAAEVVAALELLERRALLARDGDAYRFAHDLVRQVVYADLSEPRRRLMHRRVAQWLAQAAGATDAARADQLVADVARHATLAGDAALAAEACLRAARRSLRVFANGDAYALARRGARHAERLEEPERTKRLLELAEVAFDARGPENPDAESKRIEALAERALDLGCLEHARLGFHVVAFLRWERGVWSDAKKSMLQAELVSRGASEVERVRGMAEAARCLVLLERDLSHAQALALEAAARGRQAGIEPPATFDALGMLELHRGRLSDAASELERARGLARSHRLHHDEFQALEHTVMLEIERGDWKAALARAEELCGLGERFREGSEAPFARALVALAKAALGAADAQTELEREIEALTTVDAKHRLAYVLTRAAFLDLAPDADGAARDRARTRATRALSIAELLERPTEIVLSHAALLRCAQRAGDGELAARHRAALASIETGLVSAAARRMFEESLGSDGGAS